MTQTFLWQTQLVDQLSQQFQIDEDVKALILTGSLVASNVKIDIWSDIDLKVVLTDHAIDRYWATLGWLNPYGAIIGVEKHEHPLAKTLRVCLDGFKRLDFVFIPQSTIAEQDLLTPPATTLWSRPLSLLPKPTVSHPTSAAPAPISPQTVTQLADSFWYKASVAITKVARNDLLIALHLALDLARDYLVLQMIRRDQEKQTNIHRTGGWGNELVGRFNWEDTTLSAVAVLNLIAESGHIFDQLALDLSASYKARLPLLLPTIESAKKEAVKNNL